VGDVRLLARALGAYYCDRREDLLAAYTATASQQIWRATHFSWWMTSMLHKPAGGDPFDDRLAMSQLDWVASSRAMATALAENYTGLPYEHGWSYR
jgi:p-hydroxybenzoate 3-monooxygenase